MPFFSHDGVQFRYLDAGAGTPFVFQHGLGGGIEQITGLIQPPPGVRLLTLECRGHGETRPLGAEERVSIPTFAADVRAWMDHLGVARAIVGGVSMGAAVALSFALRHPDRLLGLVLSRVAWLDAARPESAALCARIARLIRTHGAKGGRAVFEASAEYQAIVRDSPAAARSLLGHFDRPRPMETAVLLEQIPSYVPEHGREDWATIAVPTLVLANRKDPIHPYEYGEALARAIPRAEFRELTPKAVDAERHSAEVRAYVSEFARPFARA